MWQSMVIDGIEAELFEPAVRHGTGAILYLHGHGGERLSTSPVFTEIFAAAGLPVLAPRGGRSWWLDVVTAEFPHTLSPLQFLRTKAVEAIRERWGISSPNIALLGVSMGGQGVLQLAYRHAREFPCVAAIAPAIDFHEIHGRGFEIDQFFATSEAARQHTATLQIHPLNWPKHQFLATDPLDHQWHSGAARLVSKLSSSGIPFTADLETSQGGHNWNYFALQGANAVQFLSESLHKLQNETFTPLPRTST